MGRTERKHLTRKDVLRVIKALQMLHDQTSYFLNKCGRNPSLGSQAAEELKVYQCPESVVTAYSQGGLLIEVAADHLMAFIKTVTEPIQTIAPWTCVRGTIEASALAAWLLDPSITVETRVQRSFAFRFEGISQQVTFGRVSGDSAVVETATKRLDEIEEKALAFGFSKVVNRKSRRIGIAQVMPSVTDIVAKALDAEAEYRLLSAMTHAHPSALFPLGFQKVEGLRTSIAVEANGAETQVLKKSLLPIAIVFLSATLVDVVSQPNLHKCQLFGWDKEPLEAMFNYATRDIGVSRIDFWN